MFPFAQFVSKSKTLTLTILLFLLSGKKYLNWTECKDVKGSGFSSSVPLQIKVQVQIQILLQVSLQKPLPFKIQKTSLQVSSETFLCFTLTYIKNHCVCDEYFQRGLTDETLSYGNNYDVIFEWRFYKIIDELRKICRHTAQQSV